MATHEEERSHEEFGLREARSSLSKLVDRAFIDRDVIFITKHGKRMAMVAHPETLISSSESAEGPLPVPGNVHSALDLIQAVLIDDERRVPDLSRHAGTSREELIGGIATLVFMLTPLGETDLVSSDSEAAGLLAMYPWSISRKMAQNEPTIARSVPTVAGAIMAAFLGQHPAEWRNSLGGSIGDEEFAAWLLGCAYLSDLLNALHGDGVAEDLMFHALESLDDQK